MGAEKVAHAWFEGMSGRALDGRELYSVESGHDKCV